MYFLGCIVQDIYMKKVKKPISLEETQREIINLKRVIKALQEEEEPSQIVTKLNLPQIIAKRLTESKDFKEFIETLPDGELKGRISWNLHYREPINDEKWVEDKKSHSVTREIEDTGWFEDRARLIEDLKKIRKSRQPKRKIREYNITIDPKYGIYEEL